MHNIQFRRAKQEDLPTLITLLKNDMLGATRESLKEMARYKEAFEAITLDKNANLFVGVQDNHIIAMAQLNIMQALSHQGAKRGHIENVRVQDNKRGQGIGRALIQHCITHCQELGCRTIQLMTDKQRPSVKAFYQQCGFIPSHEGLKLTLR